MNKPRKNSKFRYLRKDEYNNIDFTATVKEIEGSILAYLEDGKEDIEQNYQWIIWQFPNTYIDKPTEYNKYMEYLK